MAKVNVLSLYAENAMALSYIEIYINLIMRLSYVSYGNL